MSRAALLCLGVTAVFAGACSGPAVLPVPAAPSRSARPPATPARAEGTPSPETVRLHAAIRAAVDAEPPWWLAAHAAPSGGPASYPPLPALVRSADDPTRPRSHADDPRLPPETVRRVVRQSSGRFLGCVRRGLRDDPRVRGRVVIRFTIRADGRVSRAEEELATLADREARRCLLSSFFDLRFPAPPEGSLRVRYPLAISSEAAPLVDELHDARRIAEPPPPGFAEAMREGRRVDGSPAAAPAAVPPPSSPPRSCGSDDPMCGEL